MGINFLSTFITLCLVDRVGRRPLLILGAAGMAASCFTLAVLTRLHEATSAVYVVSVLGCLGLHIVFFAFSWGICPFAILRM